VGLAGDDEHEGVSREKIRRNRGNDARADAPFRACGPRFYELVAIRRRAYTMML
jgi:hypothetical protein